MKITDASGKERVKVASIDRDDGNNLVIKGKMIGTMPVTAKLSPKKARAGPRLLTPQTFWCVLTLMFRRLPPKS